MPRSTITNRTKRQYDKLLELRDKAAAAIAATTSEVANSNFNPRLFQPYKAVVTADPYTGFVAGTAQWTITIEVSADNATWVAVGTLTPVGQSVQLGIPLNGRWVDTFNSGALLVRSTATKTGNPGNLSYGVFLAPD